MDIRLAKKLFGLLQGNSIEKPIGSSWFTMLLSDLLVLL